MLYPMKWSTSGPSRWAMAAVGPILLATAFSTAFAADSSLVGAWQLDPGQSGQAALYLFTPTRYSMVLAATDRPDIADMSKATADELRTIWGPLLANAGTYEISGELITIHLCVGEILRSPEISNLRSRAFTSPRPRYAMLQPSSQFGN